MKHVFDARRLNIDSFAQEQGSVQGSVALAQMDRLLEEAQGDASGAMVQFQAQGSLRPGADGVLQPWVPHGFSGELPKISQALSGPVHLPVTVEREFRFVATEEIAALEDEEAEEDVLVAARDFNLQELVEDELLMALPPVPKHGVCPAPVKLQVADADFVDAEAEKPNPFAILGQLKNKH